ncbi:MAG: hypothetical protein LBL23_00420 [Coriobacteriales bacterium]|jgi:hypothetical protein|nr:hypothetical protein [Coriobacteriales bacterium]
MSTPHFPKQRIRVAKPARRALSGYLVVTAILLAFLLGLILLVALELLLIG